MNTKYFICVVLLFVANNIDANAIENDAFSDSFDMSIFGPDAFGLPDPKAGEILAKWDPNGKGNAEEQGTYMESDIFFEKPKGRNGIRDVTKRWTGGIIPYTCDSSFSSSQIAIIIASISEFHSKTNVRFVARTNEVDFVAFTSADFGCYSAIGKVGGRQVINLQLPGCLAKGGTVTHLMMHTLGFFHEHTRWERDNYISINSANIIPAQFYKFDKKPADVTIDFGVEYDYGSIMHYSPYAYSLNGQTTITALNAAAATNMGQRNGLSPKDILKINFMYASSSGSGSGSGSGGLSIDAQQLIIDLMTCITSRYQQFLILSGGVGVTGNAGFETND